MIFNIEKFDFSKAQYETTKLDVSEIAYNYNVYDIKHHIESFDEFLHYLIEDLVTVHEDAIEMGDEEDIVTSSLRFADIVMIFHLNLFVPNAINFKR